MHTAILDAQDPPSAPDPLYSTSVFAYDTDAQTLRVLHPLGTVELLDLPGTTDENGMVTPTPTAQSPFLTST